MSAGMDSGKQKHVPEPIGTIRDAAVPEAWLAFIRFCRELGHGEIERLSIQNGLPVLAELTKKKVKFTS